jgi:hypothetical protein
MASFRRKGTDSIMTPRDVLSNHQADIAAADREIERLENLAGRLEKQSEEPEIARADLQSTIKAEAAKLLAAFGYGINSGERDDAAHLQAAAAVEARQRAAAVAAEALVEVNAKLALAREHRAGLVKLTDSLVAAMLEDVTVPLVKRYENAISELRDIMSCLHAAQPYLPSAYGGVGARSPWQNFTASIPNADYRTTAHLRPDDLPGFLARRLSQAAWRRACGGDCAEAGGITSFRTRLDPFSSRRAGFGGCGTNAHVPAEA